MSKSPKPLKPLRILTIDGAGLQGIATLTILDNLLKKVAQIDGVPTGHRRPCDVFDVIAGIGSGGWLALLLGRFHLTISAALAEWQKIIDHITITPRTKIEGLKMRLKKKRFDVERLSEYIDQIFEFYDCDRHMLSTPPKDVRCKYVFVAAVPWGSLQRSHLLFRTYDYPYHYLQRYNSLDESLSMRKYTISQAFVATGAAKFFSSPWRAWTLENHRECVTRPKHETFSVYGRYWSGHDWFTLSDIQFFRPHNITGVALDEMCAIYGTNVEVSVVVNIGPGPPNASDVNEMMKPSIWGSKLPTRSRPPTNNNRFTEADIDPKEFHSHAIDQSDQKLHESEVPDEDSVIHNAPISEVENVETPGLIALLISDSKKWDEIDQILKKANDDIVEEIKQKIQRIGDQCDHPCITSYYQLAPKNLHQVVFKMTLPSKDSYVPLHKLILSFLK